MLTDVVSSESNTDGNRAKGRLVLVGHRSLLLERLLFPLQSVGSSDQLFVWRLKTVSLYVGVPLMTAGSRADILFVYDHREGIMEMSY